MVRVERDEHVDWHSLKVARFGAVDGLGAAELEDGDPLAVKGSALEALEELELRR